RPSRCEGGRCHHRPTCRGPVRDGAAIAGRRGLRGFSLADSSRIILIRLRLGRLVLALALFNPWPLLLWPLLNLNCVQILSLRIELGGGLILHRNGLGGSRNLQVRRSIAGSLLLRN